MAAKIQICLHSYPSIYHAVLQLYLLSFVYLFENWKTYNYLYITWRIYETLNEKWQWLRMPKKINFKIKRQLNIKDDSRLWPVQLGRYLIICRELKSSIWNCAKIIIFVLFEQSLPQINKRQTRFFNPVAFFLTFGQADTYY